MMEACNDKNEGLVKELIMGEEAYEQTRITFLYIQYFSVWCVVEYKCRLTQGRDETTPALGCDVFMPTFCSQSWLREGLFNLLFAHDCLPCLWRITRRHVLAVFNLRYMAVGRRRVAVAGWGATPEWSTWGCRSCGTVRLHTFSALVSWYACHPLLLLSSGRAVKSYRDTPLVIEIRGHASNTSSLWTTSKTQRCPASLHPPDHGKGNQSFRPFQPRNLFVLNYGTKCSHVMLAYWQLSQDLGTANVRREARFCTTDIGTWLSFSQRSLISRQAKATVEVA